jgi:hypothetical protein
MFDFSCQYLSVAFILLLSRQQVPVPWRFTAYRLTSAFKVSRVTHWNTVIRNSSVGIVIMLQAGRFKIWYLAGALDFFPLYVPDQLLSPSSSPVNDEQKLFPGSDGTWTWDCPYPSGAQIKYKWRYTCTPPYFVTARTRTALFLQNDKLW